MRTIIKSILFLRKNSIYTLSMALIICYWMAFPWVFEIAFSLFKETPQSFGAIMASSLLFSAFLVLSTCGLGYLFAIRYSWYKNGYLYGNMTYNSIIGNVKRTISLGQYCYICTNNYSNFIEKSFFSDINVKKGDFISTHEIMENGKIKTCEIRLNDKSVFQSK